MFYVLVAILLIVCVILFAVPCLRERMHLIEYSILLVGGLLYLLISYLVCYSVGTDDVEYCGYYVTRVEYYEEWDEYIHKTCTRTVHDGYDSEGNEKTHEERYDCSYVDNHPERWIMVRNDGHEIYIDRFMYDMLCKRFKTPVVFKDMHRHYHRKDGDMYYCNYGGDRNGMYTLCESKSYKNKILGSRSVFNFSEVSEKDFSENGLHDYPEFNYKVDQNPVIGMRFPPSVVDSFRYINGLYGGRYQFRTYLIVFKNQPMSVAKLQEDYFVGGNKNELITCVSVDDAFNVQWVYCFSWEDTPLMSVEINHLYENGEHFDPMKLNRYILKSVPTKWHRKEFKDFEYITYQFTSNQVIWVSVLFFILVGVIIVFSLGNDLDKDN